MIEVIALAILQGIAEFLPVSSSGHLIICEHLLHFGEQGVRLDIFLHVGTLLSVFVFYFAVIRRIVTKLEWRYVGLVLLSAVPAGILGLLCREQFEAVKAYPKVVGALLMVTGLVLVFTRFLPTGKAKVNGLSALWMGLAQAIAILPGLSRSGMTIAAARASMVAPEEAAEFSFLMSAPVIGGAAFLDLLKSFGETAGESAGEVPWGLTLLGASVAFVVGYFALALLLRSLKSKWFWLFGPYCLTAGLLTLIFA